MRHNLSQDEPKNFGELINRKSLMSWSKEVLDGGPGQREREREMLKVSPPMSSGKINPDNNYGEIIKWL